MQSPLFSITEAHLNIDNGLRRTCSLSVSCQSAACGKPSTLLEEYPQSHIGEQRAIHELNTLATSVA